MDNYRDEIVSHYKQPHNFGEVKGATHSSRGANASCGDMIEIYVRVENGIVMEAGFRGVGCALSTASGSYVTDRVKGQKVEAVLEWDEKVLEELFGKVSPGRIRCITLPLKTLQDALKK